MNLTFISFVNFVLDEMKSVDLKIDLTGFTLQLQDSSETWSFLQPLTFSLNVKCNLHPWFQIELHFIGESMLFNLSFHHMMKLHLFISNIQEQFQVFPIYLYLVFKIL